MCLFSVLSTAFQSPCDIRDTWLSESYAWHGLPTGLGKAAPADALGDIAAAQEAAKAPVKRAVRRCTKSNNERQCLYSLLKRNRWTEDPFLHRQMWKFWRGTVPCD